jgi:RimJ/RimL family protein N-acetyltransferase
VPRTIDDLSWPTRTERLSLRPAEPADADDTWRYRRLPPVYEWSTTAATDQDEYRARFVLPERLAKQLVIELDGRIIGDLMLAVEDPYSQFEMRAQAVGVQAELGWSLDPDYQGKGYGTEAVEELIRICFAELGLRRVIANCFSVHEPSWQLMERVGMRREQHAVREALHRSGAWLDEYGYALLMDEWAARQHG